MLYGFCVNFVIGRVQQNNMIPNHWWNSYDSSAEHDY